MLYDVDMREIDFDPKTMTLANGQDVFRMWKHIWGDNTIREVLTFRDFVMFQYVLDKTQFIMNVLEVKI